MDINTYEITCGLCNWYRQIKARTLGEALRRGEDLHKANQVSFHLCREGHISAVMLDPEPRAAPGPNKIPSAS
jgi:hypothetical protein